MHINLLVTLCLSVCLFAITVTGSDIQALLQATTFTIKGRTGDSKILVATDFNGVLVTKEKGFTISKQELEDLTRKVLKPLTDNSIIEAYVVSSKPMAVLKRILKQDVPDLGLSAEHHMEFMPARQESAHTKITPEVAAMFFEELTSQISKIGYEKISPKENQTHLFSAHYRPQGSQEAPNVDSFKKHVEAVNKKMTDTFGKSFTPFLATKDKDGKSLWVHSQASGKENIVKSLLGDGKKKYFLGFCFGDKTADLKMLKAMKDRGYFGVVVGNGLRDTAHKEGLYHLEGPQEVHQFLKSLTVLVKREIGSGK